MKSAALLQRATSAKTIASSSLTAKPNFMNESPWARWSAYRAGKRYFLNSKSSPFPLYRSKRCWYSVFILTIGYRCELNAVLLSPRRTFWSIRVGLLFFPILWGTYPKLWQLYSVSHYFVCTYTVGDSCRRHLILCSDTIIIINDIYKPFLNPFTGLAHCIEKQEKDLINIQLGNVILELAVCRRRIRSQAFSRIWTAAVEVSIFPFFPSLTWRRMSSKEIPARSNLPTILPMPGQPTQSKVIDIPRPKRTRAKRSCDLCRKKRTRCNADTLQPCTTCRIAGIPCQFLDDQKKRGPSCGGSGGSAK